MSEVSVRRGPLEILQQVCWTLPRGARCVVLGPNGSGKTTLMRTITGFIWPTTGTVRVLGEQLGRTDMRAIRRRIAVVDPAEQYGVDSELTALQAVLTGYFGSLFLYDEVTDSQRNHAISLLQNVGLAHRLDHKLALLSTGERRRCLLARSLVHLPDLLILDEPTAGLDIAGRERVLATIDLLQRKHPTLSIIMVTHHVVGHHDDAQGWVLALQQVNGGQHVEEISPATGQVLLLSQGRIAAMGKPEQVLTPENLSKAFGCKVFVQRRSGRWWLEVLPEAWLELLKP